VLDTHPQYQNAATQCGVTQILHVATFDLDTSLEVFDITLADTVRIYFLCGKLEFMGYPHKTL
jgi:hypothetical protein